MRKDGYMAEQADIGAPWVLLLAGPFTLVLLLVFSPSYLTALGSGDALLISPLAQTIASISWMALVALISATGAVDSVRKPVAVASCVFPAIAGLLALFVHEPAIPLINALLLGTSCVCQLSSGARLCRHADSRRMPVLVGAALALASLLNFMVVVLFKVEAYGVAVISFASCACALGFAVADKSPRADSERRLLPLASLARAVTALRYDWKPLVGGVVCAVSLGLSWNSPISHLSSGFDLAILVGKLLGALALCWTCFRRDRNLTARSFDYALAIAGCGSVAVWAVGGGDYVNPVLLAFASAAQVMFIGMLWIETCYTARDLSNPQSLPLTGMAVFFFAYVIGALLSLVLPPSAAVVIVPVLNLGFLLVFMVGLIQANSVLDSGQSTGRYDAAFAHVTEELATCYALSAREAEVLPYLVLGISSPAIAERLFVSPHTVKSHASRIYAKMDIHSHDELIAIFEQHSHLSGKGHGSSDNPNHAPQNHDA